MYNWLSGIGLADGLVTSTTGGVVAAPVPTQQILNAPNPTYPGDEALFLQVLAIGAVIAWLIFRK